MSAALPARRGGRAAGAALAFAAGLSLVAIAHHPMVGAARGDAELLAGIARLAAVDRAVHATLIVLGAVQLWALIAFALGRGATRGAVLAGIIAQGISFVAVAGAALVDGFLTPALAEASLGGPHLPAATVVPLLAAGAIVIQAVSRVALYAAATAAFAWSLDLMRGGTGRVRAVGVAGLLAALVSAGVLAAMPRIDPRGLLLVVLVQDLWYLALAWLLWRGDA